MSTFESACLLVSWVLLKSVFVTNLRLAQRAELSNCGRDMNIQGTL